VPRVQDDPARAGAQLSIAHTTPAAITPAAAADRAIVIFMRST
jgi:hypothetical protein